MELNNDIIENKIQEIEGIAKEKRKRINHYNNNDDFLEYTIFLDDHYKEFTVSKFKVREDYENHFKELYGYTIPKVYLRLFDEASFFITSFQLFEKSIEISNNKKFLKRVNTEDFILQFYNIVDHKVNDIGYFNEFIKKQYIKYDRYEEYILVRNKIFDLYNLKCKPINEYDFFEELANFISNKNINIDEYTTSVAKYSSLIQAARREYERNKKNSKKKRSENLSEA